MITNALLFVVYAWVSGLASLLSGFSDVQASSTITSSVSTASGYLHVVYNILPNTMTAILAVLAILLVFELALGTYKLIKWGYSKIPGIN